MKLILFTESLLYAPITRSSHKEGGLPSPSAPPTSASVGNSHSTDTYTGRQTKTLTYADIDRQTQIQTRRRRLNRQHEHSPDTSLQIFTHTLTTSSFVSNSNSGTNGVTKTDEFSERKNFHRNFKQPLIYSKLFSSYHIQCSHAC